MDQEQNNNATETDSRINLLIIAMKLFLPWCKPKLIRNVSFDWQRHPVHLITNLFIANTQVFALR